jgi:hypothetical protein
MPVSYIWSVSYVMVGWKHWQQSMAFIACIRTREFFVFHRRLHRMVRLLLEQEEEEGFMVEYI